MPEVAPKVEVPCPQCSHAQSLLLYRHTEEAALMCPECEHIWALSVSQHEVLRRMLPTHVSRHR